jgi:uncharacterized RDD family membrane protein YckC
MGGFDEVKILPNPEPLAMQEAIETLFSGRDKADLALLFFSGHGVKDDSGRLYFASRLTRKNLKGELVKATAVPASFVQDIMINSRCKRQVVILDCCFSGAFAEGMTAKDDGVVDVQTQLGGEGRAVLTSSTSTQYSFEQRGSDLSVYTRYIVEGIETGAADLDSNGMISIDNLHEYACKKVQEAAPAMKPKIYAVEEGFKIQIAKAPVGDPKLRYRREVERFASRGEISDIGRYTLEALQGQLGLSSAEATEIEAQVVKPYQDYKKKLQQYEQVFIREIKRENPLSDDTRSELKRFQEVLSLEDTDINLIERRIIAGTSIEQRIISHKDEPKLYVSQSSSAPSSATAPPQVQPKDRRENPSQHQSQPGEQEAQAPKLKTNHVLRYASFWRRITAFLIDGVISYGIALISVTFLTFFIFGGTGCGVTVFIFNFLQPQCGFSILAVAPVIVYYVLMEISPLKATVGKLTVGIVVTDLEGGRISLPRAILRFLIWLFSVLLTLFIGVGILVLAIPFFTSEKQQCLHDYFTKCVVVRR